MLDTDHIIAHAQLWLPVFRLLYNGKQMNYFCIKIKYQKKILNKFKNKNISIRHFEKISRYRYESVFYKYHDIWFDTNIDNSTIVDPVNSFLALWKTHQLNGQLPTSLLFNEWLSIQNDCLALPTKIKLMHTGNCVWWQIWSGKVT